MAGGAETSRYFLPHSMGEVDRLDLLHYATRATLHADYLAPVRAPARILDVGTGTGQWAYELAEDFGQALVVGLDLVPTKPRSPANYRFVRGNLLQGLPFGDGRFDFVHQRLLVSGIPVRNWPAAVAELVRVTAPAGWVELTEAAPFMEPEGPATHRLYELLARMGREHGLDTHGVVIPRLGRYLLDAGAEHVQTRTVNLPIGRWADRVGEWIACNYRVLFTMLAPRFERAYGLPESECRELVATMLQEFEQLKPTIECGIAFGQRPA
jgi:ubiquinone/menaquinone biosynthesis C-methylase UbiE